MSCCARVTLTFSNSHSCTFGLFQIILITLALQTMAVSQLGLHVITTTFPTLYPRVENQCFGRTSRQGHLPSLDSRVRSIIDYARKKQGVHTINHMSGAGFQYSGENAAKCNDCGLEVTDWKSDMSPFHVHAERSPDCPFIRKTRAPPVPKPLASSSSSSHLPSNSSTTLIRTASSLSEDSENPSKRQRTELADTESLLKSLLETESLMRIRRRTFSHWTASIPSSAQMIEAGFFNCNVGDRVICIYCNLICQQWTAHTDDPCEVHKTLSPICIYVKSKLMRPAVANILIVNDRATSTAAGTHSPASSSSDALRSHEIVYTAACHPAYTELPKRQASYQKWISDKLPPVDELVRAGFFYTGTNTIVTCFYCNGSLQNWGPKDNPMIEHARWFPHCPYAKQLCGDDLYRKIQESKRAQQERVKAIEQKEKGSSIALIPNSTTANSRQLQIPDESTLSRLVAARLDLPVSQGLLDRKFKLSIIKRCWEDQLRLKRKETKRPNSSLS